MALINIEGLDKAAVLAALYNRSFPQLSGRSFRMSLEEAQRLIAVAREDGEKSGRNDLYFDYVKGKVIKTDLSRDTIDPRLYDRDNGPGAAEEALLQELTNP